MYFVCKVEHNLFTRKIDIQVTSFIEPCQSDGTEGHAFYKSAKNIWSLDWNMGCSDRPVRC